MENGTLDLFIPTPNSNETGLKQKDRFVFNPSLSSSEEDCQMFRFLGILFGVAIRTKKPLDLHLAPFVWKLLAGMQIYLFVCFYNQNNFIFTLNTKNAVIFFYFNISNYRNSSHSSRYWRMWQFICSNIKSIERYSQCWRRCF